VVVEFYTTWSGPCKNIGPIFELLSGKHGEVRCLKVDADEHSDIVDEVGIRIMPTFIMFHNGMKIHEVVGADPTGLCKLLGRAEGVA
jgi:thioredoxin 1